MRGEKNKTKKRWIDAALITQRYSNKDFKKNIHNSLNFWKNIFLRGELDLAKKPENNEFKAKGCIIFRAIWFIQGVEVKILICIADFKSKLEG